MTLRSSRARAGARLRASLATVAVVLATLAAILGGSLRIAAVDATLSVAVANASTRQRIDHGMAHATIAEALPPAVDASKTTSSRHDRDANAGPCVVAFGGDSVTVTTASTDAARAPHVAPLRVESHAQRHARLMVLQN